MNQDEATAKMRWTAKVLNDDQSVPTLTKEGPPPSNERKPKTPLIPYFRSVQGPDGLYHWAKCPVCAAVIKNQDGYGPGRHWATEHSTL